MKKTITTIFAVLALCLVFCIAPKAEAATVASGSCGEKATWSLSDTGTLTISGSGAMTDYTEETLEQIPWLPYVESIKSISIGNSVTHIGNFSFAGCAYAQTVTIGSKVATIGDGAFMACMSLSNLSIPKAVTTIGTATFAYCENLATCTYQVDAKLTTVGDMAFYDCYDLKRVKLPYSTRTIGVAAYAECSMLNELYIQKGVTSIGDAAFMNCVELTEIALPSTLKTMGIGVFYECTKLSTLTVSGSNFYAVNNCLYSGDKKELIQLAPGFGGDLVILNGVTTIRTAACASTNYLGSVTMPDTVTVIGESAFEGCHNIKTINLSKNLVQLGESAFKNCSSIQSITIPGSLEYITANAFLFCSGLKSLTIENGVVAIEANAFEFCTFLQSLALPASVTYIGDGAFVRCTSLTEVDLGSVTYIGDRAFAASKLSVLAIPASVKSIGSGAFENGGKLTQVTFKGDAPIIAEDAFSGSRLNAMYLETNSTWTEDVRLNYGAASVNWIPLPDFSYITGGEAGAHITWWLKNDGTLELTGTGDMYNSSPWAVYANDIIKVELEDGITSVGSGAFKDCAITEILLPDSVTTINSGAFRNCSKLETVVYHETIDFVGVNAFYNTAWLEAQPDGPVYVGNIVYTYKDNGAKHVEIREGTLGISESAFADSKVQSVSFPKSLQYINYKAFFGCGDLTKITFNGPAVDIAAAVFSGADAIVYYPVNEHSWTEEVRKKDYGGNLWWVPFGEVEKFDIDVSRMILGNALEFQFGVAQTRITDPVSYYAVIEKGSVTKTIPGTQWQTVGPYYAIVYDGLAAKEMADTIRVTIYRADGEAVSHTKTDSVRDYVSRAFDGQTAAGKTMMVDMLNYGAAAQQKFQYNTGDLANSKLTDAQKACGTVTAAVTSNNQTQGANYMGTRLVLESRIQMQVAFKGMDRTMYAVYSFTDHDGAERTVTVKGKDFIAVGDLYGVELSQLVYADARSLVTVQVFTADGTLYGQAQDSIESYICRSGANDALFDALIKFTDSAKIYLS